MIRGNLKRKFKCWVSIVIIAIRSRSTLFSQRHAWTLDGACRWCSSHHKPRLLNGNPASSHAGVFFFFLKLQENHDLFTRELSCVATLSYIITIALLIKSSLYTLFSILHISAFFKIVQWKCVGSETIPLLILRLRNICWCENIPRANNSFRPYSIIYFIWYRRHLHCVARIF